MPSLSSSSACLSLCRLDYLHRLPIERLGLVILALVLKQTGEVAVVSCNGGMVLAESQPAGAEFARA